MTTRDVSEPQPPPSSTSDPDEPRPSGGVPATDVFGQPGGNLDEDDRTDEGATSAEDSE
jgi:hypothetical protein